LRRRTRKGSLAEFFVKSPRNGIAKKGRPVPVIDGLLAATALHHDLILVTRNGADVSGAGVPTLNPWQ
jgi:predicted nucleic acid-binding protein